MCVRQAHIVARFRAPCLTSIATNKGTNKMVTTKTQKEIKFTMYSGSFLTKTGSMFLDEEHHIGVSTSGNKDNVLIKSLGCEVSVINPMPYFGSGESQIRTTWRIRYNVWSRSKGTWGKREMYQELDKDFVSKIIGWDYRTSLESELLTALQVQLEDGLNAIKKEWSK